MESIKKFMSSVCYFDMRMTNKQHIQSLDHDL